MLRLLNRVADATDAFLWGMSERLIDWFFRERSRD